MGSPAIINEMVIDLSARTWGVGLVEDQTLIGPVQYGWDRYQKDPQSLALGGGLLAGSPLPGTRRMIFAGYSPAWEGFYVSAMGGAMYTFHRLGINYAWLRGQSSKDIVLVINLKDGNYTVGFESINPDEIWKGYTDENGRTWQGFYALQRFIFEKYRSQFDGDWFRILTVGPAARYTREGAIGSNAIRKGNLSVIDDWAGRGGLGSQLLQRLHVAGIVYGGDFVDPALKEGRLMDEYFLEHYGQRAINTDLLLSQKYRYVPKFDSGGTFGVNMHEVEDRLLSFNYQSIHATDDQRQEQNDNFIRDHYLKQFDEEIIEPRHFDHCGEPCAIVCKKYNGEYKKDYEPYQALGPNCGIFDQRAAEQINKYVDSLGWDAIQAGGTVSWIMELIAEGVISPDLFGLPSQGPRFNFASRPDQFDPVVDSAYNAQYAQKIIDMIFYSPQGKPFRKGLRSAAKYLDRKYKIRSIDRAVYNAHGKTGCMVPNQYWVPGMYSPMPLMGKYFSFYGLDFLPPDKLGRKNVERFVYELYSENSGSCRFHRKWVEDIVDEIITSHFDLKLEYWQANFKLAKAIHDHQSSTSVSWESERVLDIIQGFLEKWQREGLKDTELDQWVTRFRADKRKAGNEFWQANYNGMCAAFEEQFDEPAHVEHGLLPPAQK